MSKHLFRLLFGVLFLAGATAFTGCGDDDNKNSAEPKLSISSESLNFTDETETTQTVDITANCEWKVVKTSLDWATVEPMTGKGNAKLSVSVQELPAGTASRTGKITFTLIHPEFGNWGEAGQSITVTQSSGNIPTPPPGEALYSEDAGTTVSKVDGYWPNVDAYTGWTRKGTLDQSGVTYGGSKSSVRNSGKDYDPDASDEISGPPYVTVKTFDIKNINVGTNNNFTFTFAAQNTVSTLSEAPYTPTFGDITASSFNFSVSIDGTNYAKVAFVPVKTNSSWYKCTAQFKLPAAATTSTISVRFDGFTGGTTLRTDDFKLFEGGSGAELDFSGDPGPGPGENATIAQVIAGTVGSTYTTQGQIVAVNGRSFLIQDATGRMLVYRGWDKDTSKPVYEYAAAIGQTVKVTGKTTTYSKLVQFSEEGLSVEKVSDGTFTQPAPEKFDGPAFDAYKAAPAPVVKYIEYTGTLAIDGFYYNIAVDGTELQGSLAYPADGFVDASLDGQVVTVKGYTLGMTNGARMLSTIAVSVEKAGNVPATPSISVSPASLSFAAAGEAKDVTVTKTNADDCTIEASSDNGQFTAAVNGTKVTVTAKENTTADAITGTLTVKLMKAGSAVDTKTVALSQAVKSQGGGTETTVTMSFADIKAGNTTGVDMPVNSYGKQDVTNPATWYTWTHNGLDFTGVKMCEANATDYVGTLQMQGNASDAKKQGFFGNVTDLGKITKIVVVSKNVKYSPTEHLYMGTEANPTGNAQTSTIEQDGQIYTETFNINGDFGFFKLHNDKQGAFYVQSISITYTK